MHGEIQGVEGELLQVAEGAAIGGGGEPWSLPGWSSRAFFPGGFFLTNQETRQKASLEQSAGNDGTILESYRCRKCIEPVHLSCCRTSVTRTPVRGPRRGKRIISSG